MLLSFHDITQDHKSHVWLRPAGSTFCFPRISVFQASVSVCLTLASGWLPLPCLDLHLPCLDLGVAALALVSPCLVPSFHCLGLASAVLPQPLPLTWKNASTSEYHWNLCLICQFVTNMTGRANSTKAYKTAFGNWCTSLDSMDFLQCTCPSWWSTKP